MATDLDEIPPCLHKDGTMRIAKSLSHSNFLSLATGIVLTEFKCCKIIPIYKSGSRMNVDNYRPITVLPPILPIPGFLRNAFMPKRFRIWNKISFCRFENLVFVKPTQPNLLLTLFLDNIRREMDSGNLCGAVFIGLCKAFDTISHSFLISKLPEYGIIAMQKEWFTDYIFGRKQCVVYDGCSS